jgi:predicted acylesterase/phospholipase RssA
MKKYFFILVFVVVALSFSSCETTKSWLNTAKSKAIKSIKRSPSVSAETLKSDIYLVKTPDERAKNRDKYFSHEYTHLNLRRNDFGYPTGALPNSKPPKIVSLGLSGGGIRSNAFQLGLLSGLNKTNLLNRIDYISSVSGGSWANGAYWSNSSPDREIFSCLDSIAENKKITKCNEFRPILRTSQAQAVDRKLWRNEIIKTSLLGKDIYFSDFLAKKNEYKYKYTEKKPYPIFNITHSAIFYEKPNVKNHPFEITPHEMGTIVDCGSGDKFCDTKQKGSMAKYILKMPKGFFVKNNSQKINILSAEFTDETRIKLSSKTEKSDSLAFALATSSAFFGLSLGLNFNFKVGDKFIAELQENYYLTDGGKSENLGFIPLVERGSDLIIISQIGYDPDPKFGNFEKSTQQVKRLLNRDINFRKVADHKKKVKFITHTDYKFNGKKEGDILFVKPTRYNVKEFINFLKTKPEYKHALKAIEEDTKKRGQGKKESKGHFPQTPTAELKVSYPENLIFAYYLLGKYIAENKLSSEVKKFI